MDDDALDSGRRISPELAVSLAIHGIALELACAQKLRDLREGRPAPADALALLTDDEIDALRALYSTVRKRRPRSAAAAR